jgi:hypothetical protein
MFRWSQAGLALASLLVLPLTGCGGKKAEPLVPVKGRLVNAAGKPLANVILTFHPQEEVNKGHRGDAFTDKDGRFSANNCVRGRYKVTLEVPRKHGQAEPAGGLVAAPGKDGGNAGFSSRYRDSMSTPLEVTVPEGGKEDVVLTVR